MMWTCLSCEASAAGSAVTHKKNAQLCDWCLSELKRTGRAWCTRGRHAVPLATMAAGKSRCKPCERARTARYEQARPDYAKEWRTENAEHVKAHAAAYRATHRDRLLANARARYWSDPDRARARSRARHARLSAQRRAWRKAQYWSRPEYERQANRQRYVARKLAILRGLR
jgi:hypothetical protein